MSVELEEAIEGNDVLVVVFRLRGQGRTSRAAIEGKQFIALPFEDGQIRRGRAFGGKQEVLEAVGLKE